MTAPDLLTRALQALERALDDTAEVIHFRVEQYGENYRPERLKAMRDDLAAGQRAAEELRAMLAKPQSELSERLRKPANTGWEYSAGTLTALCEEAADEIDRLTAALAAASAPGAPAGWKLVPVEPTTAMDLAGMMSSKVLQFPGQASVIFRAMLSASPPPPTEQARPGSISARACEWSQDYSVQWTDRHYGFSIIEDQDDELPFAATWGEGDAAEFATLEEAKAWCQSQVDGWIAKYAVLPGQQSEQARQPLTDEQIEKLRGLDTDKRVRFYEHDFYVLSNFSAFNLEWEGLTFPTSEHAYHWEKFAVAEMDLPGGRSDIAYIVMTAPSAHEAFKVAERNRAKRRADWDVVKVDVMRRILRAKADQHEYVRRKLLATGDRELVEDSWRDDFWGWGPNRDGKNMLGRLWMEVRAELRAHGIEPAKDATP